jgi:hypothetical protein
MGTLAAFRMYQQPTVWPVPAPWRRATTRLGRHDLRLPRLDGAAQRRLLAPLAVARQKAGPVRGAFHHDRSLRPDTVLPTPEALIPERPDTAISRHGDRFNLGAHAGHDLGPSLIRAPCDPAQRPRRHELSVRSGSERSHGRARAVDPPRSARFPTGGGSRAAGRPRPHAANDLLHGPGRAVPVRKADRVPAPPKDCPNVARRASPDPDVVIRRGKRISLTGGRVDGAGPSRLAIDVEDRAALADRPNVTPVRAPHAAEHAAADRRR